MRPMRKTGAMKDEDIARVLLEIGQCDSGAGAPPLRGRRDLERALGRKEQLNAAGQRSWLDGQGEAHLIALGLRRTAGGPGRLDAETVGRPAGRMRDSGEHPALRRCARRSKKRTQAPVLQRGRLWLKECWCIPPQGSAEFVCAMEDVLEVYQRPVWGQRSSGLLGRDQQATEPALGHDRG